MKNFLEENWFRGIIAVAILIVAISAGYYFVTNSANSSQKASSEDILANQQKCAEQGSKAYTAEGYGSPSTNAASYTNHYNQKLNKCFIEIHDYGLGMVSIYLIDAYELKEWASYTYFSKGNNGGPNPVCSLDEQNPNVQTRTEDCTSQTGFDDYAATFMEN